MLGLAPTRESRRARLRIFLSYRRDDASGHAGRLYDMLAERFGPEHVFMDIDAIPLGSDFGGAINQAVSSCDVLIALIGRTWLQVTAPDGRRRLENTDDYVRREIETALELGMVVVPACVQAAEIPRPQDLPATLAPMTDRQGIELRDAAWQDDVARLIRRLEEVRDQKTALEAGTDHAGRLHRRRFAASRTRLAILGVALATVAVALLLRDSSAPHSSSDTPFGASERRLLALIPQASRPSCSRGQRDPTAEVHLSCSIASTFTVDYLLFTRRATADAWYALSRTRDGARRQIGRCTATDFRGEVDYSAAGHTAGQYYCVVHPEYGRAIVGLDHRVNVGLTVADYHGAGTGQAAIADILNLWKCCIQLQP